ncbi:UNVERIFIED_CONTAM: hypothetical protein PYX00_000310 [Menopon gallinae]|uniref:Major facilitator superfamily (MFS) profile domain-containing protein n=1 Tax=Menopon gallinae TaxID=328185 RepID=A0AAW2I8H0_9NEOP
MEPKLDKTNTKTVPLLTWSSYSSVMSTHSPGDSQRIRSRKSSGELLEETPISDHLDSTNNNRPAKPMTNGYVPEKVKFVDSRGNIQTADKDSICSGSTSGSDDGRMKKPKVPDGGWGWVVVFSSFLISMIADGVSFSFGLLYIEFLKHFEESKSKTSWIGSLFMAVPLLTGPIMSALVDRYGCKYMTMLGGTVSAFGFVLSIFGNSIEWEYVTFGLIAGSGLGLCYVTAVVSIAYWFDKYRTLATGLGACGTGVGTFIYAPLTQYFIDEYGWRGTVLLLAGIFLNMCVCGAVMRDPEWWIHEQNKQASLAGTKSIKNASSCGSVSDGTEYFKVEEIRNMLKSGQPPEYVLTTLVTAIENPSEDEKSKDCVTSPVSRSVMNIPTFVRENEKVPLEVVQQLINNIKIYNVILENYPSLLHCKSVSDGKLNQNPTEQDIARKVPVAMPVKLEELSTSQHPNSIVPGKNSTSNSNMASEVTAMVDSVQTQSALKTSRKALPTVIYSGHSGPNYLRNIRMRRNSVMYRGAMLNIPRYHLRASSCPDIYRNSMTTIAKENEEKWYADALEVLKGTVDFSMFLELHFLLMSLATILLYIWFIVPYFYLAEHLTRNDYTEVEASHLLSIIGVTNCIGMVALGWAGDQPWVNVMKTYAACLILCGICCLLMPATTPNYTVLAVVSAFFGLFFASNYSFTPTILVELIPLERFTTAYGLTLLCQGIGNLLGPPLAGWIFDITNNWELSFYMAGLWIIISGVLVILIPMTKNRRIWGSGLLEMDRVSNA